MPIKPENRSRYPKDWPQIRKRILERAKHRCEFCGVENYALGVRVDTGEFEPMGPGIAEAAWFDGMKVIKIVLTIAHLDHQPENNDPSNLRALCQRCHNRYDAEHRKKNAAATRAAKNRTKRIFA